MQQLGMPVYDGCSGLIRKKPVFQRVGRYGKHQQMEQVFIKRLRAAKHMQIKVCRWDAYPNQGISCPGILPPKVLLYKW